MICNSLAVFMLNMYNYTDKRFHKKESEMYTDVVDEWDNGDSAELFEVIELYTDFLHIMFFCYFLMQLLATRELSTDDAYTLELVCTDNELMHSRPLNNYVSP